MRTERDEVNWNSFSLFKIFYIIDWKRRKEARKKQRTRKECKANP